MKLKILTINVWRYYEWKERKKGLIEFLKKENSDIIFFQEVAYDDRLKESFDDQVDEINRNLGYTNKSFFKMAKMTKWHKEPIDWDMWYGLGTLSKFNIRSSKFITLPHIKKDKDFGFTHIILDVEGKEIDLINVHLENTDEGSIQQLKFILEWCNKRNLKPIIAGDFNIKNTDDLVKITDREYQISYKIDPYKSFMPTDFSNNSVPITLDYIIAHKDKFNILNVKCIENNVSDHNPVSAEVEIV